MASEQMLRSGECPDNIDARGKDSVVHEIIEESGMEDADSLRQQPTRFPTDLPAQRPEMLESLRSSDPSADPAELVLNVHMHV